MLILLMPEQDADCRGIRALLSGHSDVVNAVKFFPDKYAGKTILLSGSADKSIRLWRLYSLPLDYEQIEILNGHEGSINTIAVSPGSNVFVTGAADATVKVWRIANSRESERISVDLLQSILLKPKIFPLAVALAQLDEASQILAVAGTKTTIQIYVSMNGVFELVSTLAGHEGWIRCLSFTAEKSNSDSDLLLASASQDKYIRLWRVHRGDRLPAAVSALHGTGLGPLGKSLSNKAHRFKTAGSSYSITFEALLLGHEDWIFTALWRQGSDKPQLLSASADNSLAIWEPDLVSGVWVCVTRLGEISAQKGSTTATGSTGGFWIGLWSASGEAVVSLGRTGAWRLWKNHAGQDQWEQDTAISGHVRAVKGIAWSKDGGYILSTSSDQTTRLFAEWTRGPRRSWHEFSRPQIHGYDLNCIDTIHESQFISGADEKLLRVFDEPKAVADLLDKLCGIRRTFAQTLPDAANIPALGLSNKAIATAEENENLLNGEVDEPEPIYSAAVAHKSTLGLDRPPFEDHLARYMLWPEREKLYSHGYEISAVATSNNASLVATACRASSLDHAVIRLYETKEWRELKPALTAHSLTVTSLEFSDDDDHLLSVGRDRQWALFKRSEGTGLKYALALFNTKGHARMILDCSWAPSKAGKIFTTAGRDKLIKVWEHSGSEVCCRASITAAHAVTAVSFSKLLLNDVLVLAFGTENGIIAICEIGRASFNVIRQTTVEARLACSTSVNQLAWRPSYEGMPKREDGDEEKNSHNAQQLAIASEDSSLRILTVTISPLP